MPASGHETAAHAEQTRLAARLENLTGVCKTARERLNAQFIAIDGYLEFKTQLIRESDELLRHCHTRRRLSLNAQVEASRMSNAGDALGIIAHRMCENSQESADTILHVNEAISGISEQLRHIVFGLSVAKLQVEMLTYFVKELRSAVDGNEQAERDLNNLHALLEALDCTWERVSPHFGDLLPITRNAFLQLEQLGRLRQMLEFVHCVGHVEAVRSEQGLAFKVILQELRNHIGQTKAAIEAFQHTLKTFGGSIAHSSAATEPIAADVRQLRSHVLSLTAA